MSSFVLVLDPGSGWIWSDLACRADLSRHIPHAGEGGSFNEGGFDLP
jgi:hypothetical protein